MSKLQKNFDGRMYSFGKYGGGNDKPNLSAEEGYLQKHCKLCGAKAIYRWHQYGFCRDHRSEAVVASRKSLQWWSEKILRSLDKEGIQ